MAVPAPPRGPNSRVPLLSPTPRCAHSARRPSGHARRGLAQWMCVARVPKRIGKAIEGVGAVYLARKAARARAAPSLGSPTVNSNRVKAAA